MPNGFGYAKSKLLVFISVCVFACTSQAKNAYGKSAENTITYTTRSLASARTSVCGDNIVQFGEVCDDGNNLPNDGCSPQCFLEPGYMCYSSLRNPDAGTLGTMVAWESHDGLSTAQRTLSVLETAESCTSKNICQYQNKWQPELWLNVYGNQTSAVMLPPAGYYCSSFCEDTFTAPAGYEFKANCQPTAVNECLWGLAACDENAYCVQGSGGVGYSCRCDADFFVSGIGGTSCDQSGVELLVNVTGGLNGETVDRENIAIARQKIIVHLFDLGYIKKDKSDVDLVLEGALDYPLEIVESNMASVEFSGRALWRIVLRIPSQHADTSLFGMGVFLKDYSAMAAVLPTAEKYKLHSVMRCSNDGRRTCESHTDCLSNGICATQPDVTVRILSAGGSTASLVVDASGSSVISANYDVKYSAFKIRMRYDNTVGNTMNILYLSRMAKTPTREQLQTFNPDSFPCLAFGQTAWQQYRQNTVCCFDQFDVLYTTVSGFGAFVHDPVQKMRNEIDKQQACWGMDSPPMNSSRALLSGVSDFVVGPLANMPRSYASMDPSPTRGYKDVNLFLALEDVERNVAVNTRLPSGKNVRFFVGMAHVKHSSASNRLSVEKSQVDISTDITDSFTYTTPTTSTDSSLNSFVVKLALSLSMTVQTFDTSVRTKFRSSIQQAARISNLEVTIVNVQTINVPVGGQRRLLASAIRIDVSIAAATEIAANAIIAMLTLWNINAALLAVGLPEATLLEGPASYAATTESVRILLDLVVSLTEIRRTGSETATKMATISIIVSDSITGGSVYEIIPISSLRMSVGYSQDDSEEAIYPCIDVYTGVFKEEFDAVMRDQDWCATQHDICAAQGPMAVSPGGKIDFTFALPETVWDQATLDAAATAFLSRFLFIDFSLVVLNGRGDKIVTTLKTKTALKTESILRQCFEKQIYSSIEEMMQIDTFLGLAGNESEFESSLVQSLDITRKKASSVPGPLVLERDISSKESNVMTMLFKGDAKVFDESPRTEQFTLAVEDVISLHFLNDEKRVLVEKLIADGLAFKLRNTLYNNPSSYTAMQMMPTPELLAYCPMQAMRGSFGCNARREINQRALEFQTNSITSITGRADEDTHFVHTRAGLWSQNLLGGSEYARQLGYNHSKIMHEKHNLNTRYRKGFMISPTIPWRQTEIDQAVEKADSIFGLAEQMITTVLVSLDTNFGQLFQANVELTLSNILPLTRQQVIEHQLIIATAFAQAANLETQNVYLNVDTIVQISDPVLRRRRALLQESNEETNKEGTNETKDEINTETYLAYDTSEFEIVAGFSMANEVDAMRAAFDLASSFQSDDSLQARLILQNINMALARVVDYYNIPKVMRNKKKAVAPPRSRSNCYDDTEWELEITQLLGMNLGPGVLAFVGCHSRRVLLSSLHGDNGTQSTNSPLNISMRIRGPTQVSDWTMLVRQDVLNATLAHKAGWQWWDFCAPPPRVAALGDKFYDAWDTIKSKASEHCCACKKTPTIDQSAVVYQHKYTWPLRLENQSIYDEYTQISHPLHTTDATMSSDIFKISPQLRNFRLQYGVNAALFEVETSNTLPPLLWDVDENGRTLFPNCGAGYWVSSRFGCQMCHINTYRSSDVQQYPEETQAYLRGGTCTHCPPNTVAGYLRSTVADCLCVKGFYSTADDGCVMCPANFFKDTNSNEDACTPCEPGYESRSGSNSKAKCNPRISVGEQDTTVYIYTTVLGLLHYFQPVEPEWHMPHAIDQDQTMRCVIETQVGPQAGMSLDCGGSVSLDIYAKSPVLFGTQPDVLHSIVMNSSINDSLLVFHGPLAATSRLEVVVTPALGVSFLVDNVDRNDYKSRVNHISLFPRPAYMGPSPSGFVDQILHDQQWIRGTTIHMTLRMHIAHNDLSQVNAGNDVYMVNFISSRRIDTSVSSIEWQWIVCGRKVATGGSRYALCKHEPDPDNPTEQNFANPSVLDGRVTRLNGKKCCDSCYDEYDWMADCKLKHNNPRRNNLYDNTMEWVPFLHTQPPAPGATFYLYTFFTNGESAACQDHNCNEAAVYRNMPVHYDVERSAAWDNAMDFLPGTQFTYKIPVVSYKSTPMYANMLGFVSMNAHAEEIQDIMVASSLDRRYSGHSCHPTDPSSLECTRVEPRVSSVVTTTTRAENMYHVDIHEWTQQTPILPYEYHHAYAKTVGINYCCEVPDLDLTCALELQKKTCNLDDVSVENGERIHLSSEYYADALACVSDANAQCVPQTIQGLQAVRPRGPAELGAPTQISLESTRGDNRMVLGAVFTPDWTPFRIPTVTDERELRIQTVAAPGPGRVHYAAPVMRYFAGLPFCFDHENWSDFYVSRTMPLLKSMCPCKTKQNGRDNFVYFHSAELGMHFQDETVLAFFKSPGGHNSVADMRDSQNIFIVHLITSTTAFDTYALTEMQLATDSNIPKITTDTTGSEVFVGDVFTYTPPPQQNSLNITILIPHPVFGQQDGNYNILYPSTAIPLLFAGVYTIVEDSMVTRKGGATLPSQTRKYVYVRKRNSADYVITDTSVMVRVPLKYLTLTDIRPRTALLNIATKSARVPVAFSQSYVLVQDGVTQDAKFAMWQQSSSMPPCYRSLEWDKYDANVSRSNRDIDNLLPCYIAHHVNGTARNVAYFRDVATSDVYAAYT